MQALASVISVDSQAGRVLLYRNTVGNGFTYYTQTADGFHFGSNLADLVEATGISPRPNEAVLPLFFLYRFVPGRQTLFDGFESHFHCQELLDLFFVEQKD